MFLYFFLTCFPFHLFKLTPDLFGLGSWMSFPQWGQIFCFPCAFWISIDTLQSPVEVQAKIRYNHVPSPAVIYPYEPDKVRVVFKDPQRAITPGQAVVFYQNDIVVGGGWIERKKNISSRKDTESH